MCSIILSANSNNFTSFQFGFLFSFPSLNSVAKTSKTVLHNSGSSGHLCLAPNLRGNDFSLSPLKMTFALGLSYMAISAGGSGEPAH